MRYIQTAIEVSYIEAHFILLSLGKKMGSKFYWVARKDTMSFCMWRGWGWGGTPQLIAMVTAVRQVYESHTMKIPSFSPRDTQVGASIGVTVQGSAAVKGLWPIC